jgi:hypothetical protein
MCESPGNKKTRIILFIYRIGESQMILPLELFPLAETQSCQTQILPLASISVYDNLFISHQSTNSHKHGCPTIRQYRAYHPTRQHANHLQIHVHQQHPLLHNSRPPYHTTTPIRPTSNSKSLGYTHHRPRHSGRRWLHFLSAVAFVLESGLLV